MFAVVATAACSQSVLTQLGPVIGNLYEWYLILFLELSIASIGVEESNHGQIAKLFGRNLRIAVRGVCQQSGSVAPKEQATGCFTGKKLKRLSIWGDWETGEHKQLRRFWEQRTCGEPQFAFILCDRIVFAIISLYRYCLSHWLTLLQTPLMPIVSL